MANESIKINFDPKNVLTGMKDLSDGSKKLASDIDSSLGKDAVKSIDKLESTVENGTTRIKNFFKDLGHRLKEDLKTAFDITSVMGGMSFARGLGEGIKQVFDMERAFDRLNTRLHLTNKQLDAFKTNVGKRVSLTGQKIEDILPGVEVAAAKGGVKGPEQLSAIGEMLAQVKVATGEETGSLADVVVEILKSQGQKITANSFKQTLDALQSTRVQGAYKTAGEAGTAIEQLSPYAQKFKLSTRELGGLAATASKSGAAGQDILRQLFEQASEIGGTQRLNAVFGRQIFKGGKLQAGELGKIDMSRFGAYSAQTMESATGIRGAAGEDMKRFVAQFKDMSEFKNVIRSTNDTKNQFDQASDNLATSIDKMKEKIKYTGSQIGESVSHLANDAIKGNFGGLGEDVEDLGKKLWDNKETLAKGIGGTALVGAIAGGSFNRLLSKMGGGAATEAVGLAKDIGISQTLRGMGVQPVFVVNATEIGNASASGSGVGDLATSAATIATAAGGISMGVSALAIIAGGVVGGTAGSYMEDILPKSAMNVITKPADWLYDLTHQAEQMGIQKNLKKGGEIATDKELKERLSPEFLREAIKQGTHEGMISAHQTINKNDKPVLINKSSVVGNRGEGRR